MEVFYSHFPMQVAWKPRRSSSRTSSAKRHRDERLSTVETDVAVDGNNSSCPAPTKEDVGQTAADIEQLTKVSGRTPASSRTGSTSPPNPPKGV